MDTSNKKVKQILEAAQTLFYRFGLKKVTVEEICQEGGVSKMTFYKHFRNKDDLILKMLKNLYETSLEKYHLIMGKEISYPEKVKDLIHMKMEYASQLSTDFVKEYLEIANPEIMIYMQQMTAGSVTLLMDDFKRAGEEGCLRKDIKPEFLVYFINHMMDMMKDPYLSGLYPEPSELVGELINFFFYGVMSRENK